MNALYKFVFILMSNFTLLLIANAQQSVNTTGGDGKSTSGSVSFSVGQVVYKTIDGTDAKVSEGVQQPYEILIVTGLNNQLANLLNIKAYPNPTFDYITLSVDDLTREPLFYQLYDMNGRLMESKQIIQHQTKLNLDYLPSATYLIKVMTKKLELRTFKIFKS
jgi:hypothetical protein